MSEARIRMADLHEARIVYPSPCCMSIAQSPFIHTSIRQNLCPFVLSYTTRPPTLGVRIVALIPGSKGSPFGDSRDCCVPGIHSSLLDVSHRKNA